MEVIHIHQMTTSPTCTGILDSNFNHHLGGGFKYFLVVPLPGEMIQFDKYFWNGLKPPTSSLFDVYPKLGSKKLEFPHLPTEKFHMEFLCVDLLCFREFFTPETRQIWHSYGDLFKVILLLSTMVNHHNWTTTLLHFPSIVHKQILGYDHHWLRVRNREGLTLDVRYPRLFILSFVFLGCHTNHLSQWVFKDHPNVLRIIPKPHLNIHELHPVAMDFAGSCKGWYT